MYLEREDIMNDYEIRDNISKNLKKYMEENNINNKELATILNVSESTVGKWLLKKSVPRMGVIEKISNYFNIEKSELIEDKNDLSNIPGIKKFVTVPLLGEIACGEPIFCNQNYDNLFQIDEDLAQPDFSLTARGDSMIDVGIHDGDIVFFRNTPVVENGKIAAVIIDNTTTLKRFFKNEHEIILQPENKFYSPIIIREGDGQEVRVLGEMVGMYVNGSK